MSQPVGIGFIGAGEISILHAKAVKRSRSEARWPVEPHRRHVRSSARAQYGCKRYETPEELVADPRSAPCSS